MPFITDKEGHKHYRMKMDTGYLDSKGGDLNKENKVPMGANLQFNYVHLLVHPMKRIKISIPGLNQLGFKRIIITRVRTEEIVFNGMGLTIFGMTRCNLSREATEKMNIGEKYKITVKKWTR